MKTNSLPVRNTHPDSNPHSPKCRQIATSASTDRADLLSNISRLDIKVSLLYYFSDCVKGYYKRAKAHAAVWNEKEARRDFNMVAHLDITLASLCNRELRVLSERMKEKYWEEKEKYWNMLEKKENKNEEEEEVENKGNHKDRESLTRDGKDEVGEEKSKECSEGHEDELLPGARGNEEEPSPSEMNPNASNRTEGKDWQQMLRLVMLLQNEGNFLIKEKHFEDASAKFKEAVEYVDVLQNMVSVIGYSV